MPPGSLFLPCELDTSLNRNNSGAHEERTHIVEDLACTQHQRCMQRSQPIVQSNYHLLPPRTLFSSHQRRTLIIQTFRASPMTRSAPSTLTHHTFSKTSATASARRPLAATGDRDSQTSKGGDEERVSYGSGNLTNKGGLRH